MDYKIPLLPAKAKYIGWAFTVVAAVFAYLYFFGGRPAFFKVKVFALASVYLETKYCAIIQTNLLDELAAVLFIAGWVLCAFSKEKDEKKEYNYLRIKALINSLLFTLGLWAISFLLIYGMYIFFVSIVMFIVFLLGYSLLFKIYIYKFRKTNNEKKQYLHNP
jgi:hypothetical protein